MNSKHLWPILTMFALLMGCAGSVIDNQSQPAGPATKAELCQALGFDVQLEPLCNYNNDGELRTLLEKAFPIEKATQANVRARLGTYLVEERTDSSGAPQERYAIERTLISSWPVLAHFSYDRNGVLFGILIID